MEPNPGPPAYDTSDAGWAGGAAVAGYLSALLTGVLASVSVLFNEDGNEDARTVGAAATATFGVMGVVTAVGGASARNHPSVRGAPVLRVVSWVGYGLTLLDAAFLIGLSFEEDVSSAHIASVGALAVLSLIGFSVDASISASEAESIDAGRSGVSLRPSFGIRPDGNGSIGWSAGLSGRF